MVSGNWAGRVTAIALRQGTVARDAALDAHRIAGR